MKPHAIDCGCLDCLAENAKDIGKQLDAPLVGMTNQEAMRGRAREFIYDSENSPPTGLLIGRYEDSALTFAAAFALQEVASRDARIAELKDALRTVFDWLQNGDLVRNTSRDHQPDWVHTQLEFVKKLREILDLLPELKGEALKEQP